MSADMMILLTDGTVLVHDATHGAGGETCGRLIAPHAYAATTAGKSCERRQR